MNLSKNELEKRKFDIFRKIYEIESTEERIKCMCELLEDLRNLRYFITMYYSFLLKEMSLDTLKIKEEYSKIAYELYPALLGKMQKLAHELNLNNSLELSYLCNYLMYEGYLSKNKEFNFQREGRLVFRGLMFVDVINGNGVCANMATLEKDFMKFCGYKSSVMSNSMPDNVLRFYELDEDKRDSYINQAKFRKNTLLQSISSKIFMKNAHMFTIIEDKDKLYAYDPTSAIILELTSPTSAQILTGYGTCKLNPYFSVYGNDGLEDFQVIIKLFERTDFSSPYSNENFCHMIEKINPLLEENIFYMAEEYHQDYALKNPELMEKELIESGRKKTDEF